MPGKYDFKFVEPNMLSFWDENDIYKKAKEKNKGKKKFYYLDGPPYTSGKVHLGTAWGKALRDSLMRYKRMAGFNVWDRAGFDMHGLPTAHAVEKKFGIKHKEEILKFGVARFISECRKLCLENKEMMVRDFQRIGVWMGFKDAYMTLSNEYMESEWWLIKKAHEKGRLYEGKKVMHWCPSCSTALAKHELEYNNVTDDSIFLKFKVKGTENEYLLIWTTTPWTIPYNLGVMVNPEENYVKAKVGNEVWVVASKLAGVFIQGVADKKYEVLEELRGKDLEGVEYMHPLHDELKEVYDTLKKESPKVFTVVLSKEYVDTTSGSGLVHMAPGCGPEDYEIGHKYKIPPFNNLDENGVFPKEMGKFKGMVAKKDDKKFIELFKKKGVLIESTPVEHEYPHCWRCHKGVVFRLTNQWFFKVEDMKEKMRELNKKIFWQPGWAGERQFDSWLANLRDNSITRQRYWGCPVPIWKCEKCGKYEVIGSVKELEEKSGQKAPEDLHIPNIDEITMPCECGEKMKRVPDILDVWVDAGIASWACLDYPHREDLFKEWWPADFILEGKDQIRGWFNLLFVASMISMQKPSYKAVYMHGFINDAQGRKMSKSLGNYILPEEVLDKCGADTLRYYSIGAANPGLDLNYNIEDVNLKYKNMFVFWNLHNFLVDFAKNVGKNPEKIDAKVAEKMFSIEEKYIISKLNSTIEEVTRLFEEYRLNDVPLRVEELLLELSRTYIQLIRGKAVTGTDEEKEVILYTIYKVLIEGLKMFATVAPFITEQMYQDFKEEFGLKEESIHLFDWPKADNKMIDKKVEHDMDITNSIVQSALAAREKVQLGVRWPLKEMVIVSREDNVAESAKRMAELIKTQTNVKEISVKKTMPGVKTSLKGDFGKMGPDFGDMTPKIIAKLATESTERILESLAKKNKLEMKIDGKKVELFKSHFIIKRDVPNPYTEMEFKGGLVYINSERTEELEAEGYAREIMRRVQALRKNQGLEKKDRIVLFVKVDEELEEMLKKFEGQIAEKCGVDKIKIASTNPAKKHKASSKEKVKGKDFEIFFDKV